MPQSYAYQFSLGTVSAMCTAVSFDAGFDCERTFFDGFIAENCQKIGFLHLCRLFQKIFSDCTNNKSELGFVTPTGLLRNSQEFFRVRSVVDSSSGQGTLQM